MIDNARVTVDRDPIQILKFQIAFQSLVIICFVLIRLLYSHIYRMSVDYMGWSLDFTGPQMILTMKLSMYAFDVYDGTLKKEVCVIYYIHLLYAFMRMA